MAYIAQNLPNYVNFARLSRAIWDSLAAGQKSSDTLYFVLDTDGSGQLYLGATPISNTKNLSSADINDFVISAAADKNVLQYDAASGKWVNRAAVDVIGDYVSEMTGATATADGAGGLVPAPAIADKDSFLKGDGTWEKIDIEGAISAALSEVDLSDYDGAYVDVTASRAQDNSGTILTFTTADGDEEKKKEITISDLFLSAAEYDASTHILSMNLQGVTDPVEVNLEDLVPQAIDSSAVALSENITVTTKVGNLNVGDVIDINDTASLQDLLVKMLCQDSNPVTVQPSVSVSMTGAGAKEVGTEYTPTYSVTFNAGSYTANGKSQATNVTATSYTVTDSNGNTQNFQYGGFSPFTVVDATNYKVSATVTYGDGDIPKTFLGKDYAAGQIKAGSKMANSTAVTGYRAWYLGLNSAHLANPVQDGSLQEYATNKGNGANASNQNGVVIPAGTKTIVVAIPKSSSKRLISVIDVDGMNLDVKGNFVEGTAMLSGVEGRGGQAEYVTYVAQNANGYAATKYNFIFG